MVLAAPQSCHTCFPKDVDIFFALLSHPPSPTLALRATATDALSPFDGRKPVEAWKQTDNVSASLIARAHTHAPKRSRVSHMLFVRLFQVVRDRLVVLRNKPGVDGMSLEDHAE